MLKKTFRSCKNLLAYHFPVLARSCQLLVSQVKRKPQTAALTWLAEVGRCCVHKFISPTWNEMLDRSPFAE